MSCQERRKALTHTFETVEAVQHTPVKQRL